MQFIHQHRSCGVCDKVCFLLKFQVLFNTRGILGKLRGPYSLKMSRAEFIFTSVHFLHFKAQMKAEEEARQRKEAEEKEAQREKQREERRQQKLVIKHLTCFPPFSRDREEEPLPTSTHSAARVM